MDKPCISSILMAALTVGFVIADYFFNYGQRILTYIFLGSITTILFTVMCFYGYQKLNWVFLAIGAIYIFFSILYIHLTKTNASDTSDCCEPPPDECEPPPDECEQPPVCEKPKPKPKPKKC
jgi:hypothetical protein